MSFSNYDVITTTARQHQEEMLRHAAEARLVRRENVRRLDFWRRTARPNGPPAA